MFMVRFKVLKDYLDGGFELNEGELVLFENVRFNAGEKKDGEEPIPPPALQPSWDLPFDLGTLVWGAHPIIAGAR